MKFRDIPNEDLLHYLDSMIKSFGASELKRRMEEGQDYYRGKQHIDSKARYTIGKDGRLSVIHNLPNTRFKDNQYAKLVDQKVNYMLSEIPTVVAKDAQLKNELDNLFDMRFMRTLSYLAQDAFNSGIGWIYLSVKDNRLHTTIMNPLEIIPIWSDNTKESLDALIRHRTSKEWSRASKKMEPVKYLEFYTKDGVATYKKEESGYALEQELQPYIKLGEKGISWGKIPFVYFRYNRLGQTLLERVKSLQDGINTILSNFGDNMLEDPRNTILVLKGYDGQDLGEFRQMLAQYGTVKVNADDRFGQGGVETLEVSVNHSNYESILRILKEKLIENGRGVDAKTGILGSNPNEMNILSMYTDIELDCNNMEREFQASFEYLQSFIKQLKRIESEEMATITFKRNLLINQSERVEMIMASRGLVSDKTLLANHPLVDDADEELILRDEETQKRMDRFSPITLNPFNPSRAMIDE